MPNYKPFFEQQSCRNTLDFYLNLLNNSRQVTWDYVILTASNREQAGES